MNRLFDEWTRPFFDVEVLSDGFRQQILAENENHYVVTVEVPGIDMKVWMFLLKRAF